MKVVEKMIKVINVTKKLDDYVALSDLSCEIPKGSVFGLIGSNGAGKSTLLRAITGVYQTNAGMITIDDESVYENESVKDRMIYVPDELYFLPGANMKRMGKMYQSIYKNYDSSRFNELTKLFKLNPNMNINKFSKGMKRQAAIILALSTKADYLFFDETFDGLDPVKRNLVRNLIAADALERGSTVIITSHSLRELEDTCDQLALLHDGGIVFESDVQHLKTSLFKVQIAFLEKYDQSKFAGFDMLSYSKSGSVSNFIVRGDRDKTQELLAKEAPVLLEILPLSLEEVFIHEMANVGYVFDDVLGGLDDV
jgi:ABC-2 type transport system ATP-binding protein